MDPRTTTIFWLLAIIPAVLHPSVLYIYFQRFGARKTALLDLINRRTGAGRLASTQKQMQEWRERLDLSLAAYLLPVVICSILSAAGGIVILSAHDPSDQLHLYKLKALLGYAQPSIAAGFAGAFAWGIYDFVDRFRILNLSPAALHMTWFRLLLGPLLGYYVQFVLNAALAPFVAFAVGALPVPELAQWVRDKARSTLSITALQVAAPRWELLERLTDDMVRRLIEADVSSAAHLANQDPINLLRRTNVEWRNVLDMMDQAYLCGYVEDKLPKLRPLGIRGAIEMAILHERRQSGDTKSQSEADAVVARLATELGTDPACVSNLARNLFEDRQVDLIWTLWYEGDSSQPPKPDEPEQIWTLWYEGDSSQPPKPDEPEQRAAAQAARPAV